MPKAWQAATRPCSIEVEARLGNPITSPAAKMCGTEVCIVFGSTLMWPRLSTSMPTAPRLRLSMAPTRPAANSSISVVTVRPSASLVVGRPPAPISIAGHGGAEPHGEVAVAQIVHELLDQFAVDEIEEARSARLDQRDRRHRAR
jgi:hypothetical protein